MSQRRSIYLACRGIALAALILAPAAARAEETAGPPAERPLEIPPAWLQFPIEWKATWDETLQAHPENKWQEELQKNPATAPQAETIGRLRRIEVCKALMKKWPGEKPKHLDAYVEIANVYARMGWPWWSSWWGYKIAQDFPNDPQAVQRGYQMTMAWSFGQYTHWGWYGYWMRPECRDWEFVLDEILAKHKAGTLADGPAVRQAYSHTGWMIVDFADYGRSYGFFQRLRELSKTDPGFGGDIDSVLNAFGHNQDPNARKPLFEKSAAAREAQFELETRWEAAQHSELFEDVAAALDVRTVQRLLDLMAETDAAAPDGDDRTPYWMLLDKRMTAVPRERIAPLAAAQNEAALLASRTARQTGDGDELLRAFRRYPFAACLHEAMVELAERDVRSGLSQWAVPVLWSVVTHTDDASLRAQAYAMLWVGLSQDPADREELEKALPAVPDDTLVPWRGQSAPAREIKQLLLSQAPPLASAPKASLAKLEVRRVELPREWPARQQNLDGPLADLGMHAPWPASWIERVGSSLVVGAPTAVARFDAAGAAPAWLLNPEERIAESAWPWSLANGRNVASSAWVCWRANRRPVRTGGGGSADGQVYCLMNTVEPPIVAAVDAFTGQLTWSSESGHGWDGLEPLSHPAEADGRLYVLAAPPDQRTPNWRGHPRTEPTPMHLVCLDGGSGRVLWKRNLGSMPGARFDLARGSGRVVVREGKVYCASNVGLLARCAAHDGMLQWVQPYPSAVHANGAAESINPRREGAGPIIVRPTGAGQSGSMILLAPRDHTGVLAFSGETGKLLWETPFVPSDRLLGATGREVVGINDRWLTALDLGTGKQLYCREFPVGTGSAGTMIGSDVLLVSSGVVHRIDAATGASVETRALAGDPGAEYSVMPDGLIVQVVPPPLAPPPGPPTAGRKLALPLERVWSVPCESPRLLLRDDRSAAPDRFAVVSGRRAACVAREPNWRVTWEALLPRPPQAAGFTGNSLVTADLWTLSARNAEDGKPRWTRTLRFPAGQIAGDEAFTYAVAGADWGGPHYAVCDSVSGDLKWSRTLGPELYGGLKATVLRREPDGSRTLRAMANALDTAKGAWGFGELRVDAPTGKILGTRLIMGNGEGPFGKVDFDQEGMGCYMTRGGSYWSFGEQLCTALGYDGRCLTEKWARRFDFASLGSHHNRSGIHPRGSAVYARLDGYLLRYDPATGAEIKYDMVRPGDAWQPFIFDFREDGDRLVVVSGLTGVKPAAKDQKTPAATPPEQWRMYVDVFERATGKSLGRQELPGVRCCVTFLAYTDMAGYETQVRIGEDAIIVTDTAGVHVFAAKAE